MSNEENSDKTGHRQRLKARYLKTPIRVTPDYELLELLLFYVLPRSDTKPIAKNLLAKFGSLAGIINADPSDLKEVKGIADGATLMFKLLMDFHSRLFIPSSDEVKQFNVLNNWHSVLNYCRLTMGYQKKNEFFRILYLNRKNLLLADEFHNNGTIDKIAVYPREIARKVITLGASAIIMVHNHPSGDPKPSAEDIDITKQIVKILDPLGAKVHDHLIISGFDHYSFRTNNFL